MSRAYKEGVLDKDFITNTNFNEKYAQGKVGFADMHYQFSQQTNQQLQTISPGAEFVELSPPMGTNGSRGNSTPTSGTIKVVLSKDVDDEKRDRILELFDWWVSPEGEDILKKGIENIHYKKNSSGAYEMTDELKAEGEGRQSLLWNWVLRNNNSGPKINIPIGIMDVEIIPKTPKIICGLHIRMDVRYLLRGVCDHKRLPGFDQSLVAGEEYSQHEHKQSGTAINSHSTLTTSATSVIGRRFDAAGASVRIAFELKRSPVGTVERIIPARNFVGTGVGVVTNERPAESVL